MFFNCLITNYSIINSRISLAFWLGPLEDWGCRRVWGRCAGSRCTAKNSHLQPVPASFDIRELGIQECRETVSASSPQHTSTSKFEFVLHLDCCPPLFLLFCFLAPFDFSVPTPCLRGSVVILDFGFALTKYAILSTNYSVVCKAHPRRNSTSSRVRRFPSQVYTPCCTISIGSSTPQPFSKVTAFLNAQDAVLRSALSWHVRQR